MRNAIAVGLAAALLAASAPAAEPARTVLRCGRLIDGRSAAREPADYGLVEIADLLLASAEGPVALIGHSWGGSLAVAAAARMQRHAPEGAREMKPPS